MSFEGTLASGPVCACCGDVHPPPCVKIDTDDFETDWEDMGGGIFLSQHDWGERPNDVGNFAFLAQGLRIFLDLTAGGPSAAVDLIAGWTDADNYNYVRYQPAGESDLLSLWQVRGGTHTLLNGFHRMEPQGSLTLSYCWYIAYWLGMGQFSADTYTPEGELFFTAGVGTILDANNYHGPFGRRFGFRGDPSAFSRFRLIWHNSTDPHAPCPTHSICRFCADYVPKPCIEVTGHPPNGNTLFGDYEADLNGVYPMGLPRWGSDSGPPEHGNFGGSGDAANALHNGNCFWTGYSTRPTKPDGTEQEIVNGVFVLGVLWHADEELYYLWLLMHIPFIVCGGCVGGNIQNKYWGTARYKAVFGPNAPDCTSRGRFKMELFDSNIRQPDHGTFGGGNVDTSDPIDHELEEIWVDLDGECQIYYQEDIGCCDFEDLPANAWLTVGGLESEPVLLTKHVSERYYNGSSFAGEEHLRFYELQCFLLDPENNIRRWILSQSDVGLFCQLTTRSCGPFHLTEPTPQSCIFEIEVTE